MILDPFRVNTNTNAMDTNSVLHPVWIDTSETKKNDGTENCSISNPRSNVSRKKEMLCKLNWDTMCLYKIRREFSHFSFHFIHIMEQKKESKDISCEVDKQLLPDKPYSSSSGRIIMMDGYYYDERDVCYHQQEEAQANALRQACRTQGLKESTRMMLEKNDVIRTKFIEESKRLRLEKYGMII